MTIDKAKIIDLIKTASTDDQAALILQMFEETVRKEQMANEQNLLKEQIQMQKNIAESAKAIADLEKQNFQKEKEISTLKIQFTNSTQELSAKAAQMKELQNKVKTKEKELAAQKQQIKNLETKIKELEKNTKQMEKGTETAEKKQQEATPENAKLTLPPELEEYADSIIRIIKEDQREIRKNNNYDSDTSLMTPGMKALREINFDKLKMFENKVIMSVYVSPGKIKQIVDGLSDQWKAFFKEYLDNSVV